MNTCPPGSAFRADGPFLLYVGGLSPHKNLLRLVEAFALGAPEDVKLVLVGDIHDVFHTHVLKSARRSSGTI